MEEWGGVDSFELTLRRREVLRVDMTESAEGRNGTASSRALHTGRKHPTAVVSLVPGWLRENVGQGKSFDDIRRIVLQVREYMVQLREEEKSLEIQQVVHVGESASANSRAKRGGWRNAKGESKGYLRQQNSRVRFPDVEILPTFKPWVLQASLRQGDQQRIKNEQHDKRSDHGDTETEDIHDRSHEDEKIGSTRTLIDRAGSSSELSASQIRWNQKKYNCMVARVSSYGAVKKPDLKK